MVASEYVVASRSPSLYLETVTGDRPTSALSNGDRYTDLDGLTSAWNGAAWVDLPAGGGAVTPVAIYAAVPGLRSWNPAHFVGTWNNGVAYDYGDAVRHLINDIWVLCISLAYDNVGHEPTDASDAFWANTVVDYKVVVIYGNVNPNSVGEQTRITEYSTGGATGGDFSIGGSDGIEWDADAAAILATLGDNAIAVVGNADDPTFTVENYGDTLDIDGTNLTGGGATSQVETQALVVGGFESHQATVFIDSSSAYGSIWKYSDDASKWYERIKSVRSSAENGAADVSPNAIRGGSGNGDSEAGPSAERGGTGTGTAYAGGTASVTGTAVGSARAFNTATHHTGGTVSVGPLADATGSYVRDGATDALGNDGKGFKIGDLAVDPALATPQQIYQSFVDSGRFVAGS